jgi:hypothetical protein
VEQILDFLKQAEVRRLLRVLFLGQRVVPAIPAAKIML